MRLARLTGALVIGMSFAWTAVAPAAPLDDARNLLSRLNDAGDGRSAAEAAVRQAREAAEREARDKYDAAVRQLADLKTKLAALDKDHKRLELESNKKDVQTEKTKGGALKDKQAKLDQERAKIDAMKTEARERYEHAMAAATAEMIVGIQSALASIAGGAVNATAGEVQQKVTNARNGLRALIPQPVGTRPATRNERRCVQVGPAQQCADVAVPNDPSDGELLPAINTAQQALDSVGQAGQTARLHFQQAQPTNAELQAALQRLTQFLNAVSAAMKAYHEAAMAIIRNLKG